VPALESNGHEATLWYESDEPLDRNLIARESFSLHDAQALSKLRAWSPDVLYCHGLTDPDLESRVLDVAPAVFFAHNYYGTCISGGKTWKFPAYRPCSRRFGWPCLVHFYPHRCGGLNPITMVRDYRTQASRLRLLERYASILTHSHHMQREYWRHGLAANRVMYVAFPVLGEVGETDRKSDARIHERARLVFLGRMDRLKGGRLLLEAIPPVRKMLNRPIEVTFAGDGPERADWERRAARLTAADPGVTIRFPGWVDRQAANLIFDESDLLVFPSVWPEPFGLVGLEAGLRGLPVAAFATGGIPDWLKDGVNGYMANGDTPTAEGLAQAISQCLKDDLTYARLREGAVSVARQFTMATHLDDLLATFGRAIG
jgi:glycosyltransferase involved in cell wall biosynthesis